MSALKKYFHNLKHQHFFEWVVLILLLAVVCVTLFLSIRNFEILRLRGEISSLRHNKRPNKPEDIQPWMTFRYINMVFKLPPDYLQTALKITDRHYPNLSVSALARQKHQTLAQTLQEVIAAIKSTQ